MKTEEQLLKTATPKEYTMDWDKIKSFDDLKSVLEAVMYVSVPENFPGIEKIKHLLKVKQQ